MKRNILLLPNTVYIWNLSHKMLTSSLGLAFIVLEGAMHVTRAESNHSYTAVHICEILERYAQCNNGNNRNGTIEAANHFLIVVAQN